MAQASQSLHTSTARRTHKDYPIGVICALATEKAAFQAMLDEVHQPLPNLKGDENSYTLGRIGVHNVVVACLPAGMTGNNTAATVAKDMLHSFPIKIGLLVGVGGGVWSKKVDMRLGDVVVSQPNGTHGGVVQWDFGKMERGGVFRRTGSLNKPPRVLLNAVQDIKTKHITDGDRLEEHLSQMANDKPKMAQTFSYQGAEHDQLYQAAYNHTGGETCADCDIREVIVRLPARTSPAPQIHYGNIASGNQVMKDGVTRDWIAQEEGIICFEMEAAGLVDSFPCLVIRGICDYADSHKNKRWQPYAAATAAAFAKELLGVIKQQDVDELVPARIPKAHFLVPLDRNSRFVGRDTHLKMLEQKLFNEGRQRIAIYGLGGVGKTQVVLQLAYLVKERYPSCSVFWIQASSIEKVEQTYLAIGQALQIPGINEEKADVKQLVRHKLSQESTGNWLLILDNADDADIWFKEVADASWSGSLVDWLPKSNKGFIVWTTRDRKAALKMAPSQDTLSIREMEEQVATELLRKSLLHTRLMDDSQNCLRLLQQLTYLPLAIVQAASYINSNEISAAEYLSLLEETENATIAMLSEDFEDYGRYRDMKNPVATTWLISFEQIRKCSNLAADYLSFMSRHEICHGT